LRFRGATLRTGFRGCDAAAIKGTASISFAVAPARPRRPRADLTKAPTITPISKASAALSLGLSFTALAKADINAFERAAIAAPHCEPQSNAPARVWFRRF